MAVALVERAVAVQRVIHFLIAGQVLCVRCAELACRLALGERVIGDAVFGHQLGSLMGQLFAHQVALVRNSRSVFFSHMKSEQLVLDGIRRLDFFTRARVQPVRLAHSPDRNIRSAGCCRRENLHR